MASISRVLTIFGLLITSLSLSIMSPLFSPFSDTLASLFLNHDRHIPVYISLCKGCSLYLEHCSFRYPLGSLNSFKCSTYLRRPKLSYLKSNSHPHSGTSQCPYSCWFFLMALSSSNIYNLLILCLFSASSNRMLSSPGRDFYLFCSLK